MKLLGILSTSALFILLSAFHGPRGIFCSNLEVNPSTEIPTVEVSEISENLKDSTVESSSKSSAPAPKSALVFENSTWDDSMLANTIVFLDEFCKEVKGYKFSGNISEDKIMGLSGACWWVSYYVDTFSWRRVRGLHENPYEDALKPEKFDVYAIWLVSNIQNITESYKKMYNESIGLTEEQLKSAASSGPYKYGFVYTGDWWRVVGEYIRVYKFVMAPSFLQSLKDLKSSLENILNGPEEYTVKSQPSVPVTKSNLVFKNSKWHDSMLASTFLFINEFCKDVKAEKFNEKLSDKKFKGLSKKCANLSSYVGSFIHRFKPTYGPGSVAERKEIDMDFYKDVLKPEQFQVYVRWLVENIPEIWASVRQMFRDSLKLPKEQLNTDTKVGPFIYGFVHTGKPWGELTHGVNRGLFKDPDILQSFKGLKSSLDKILKSFPKDSTVESQAA